MEHMEFRKDQENISLESEHISDEEILGIVGLCGKINNDDTSKKELEKIESDLNELIRLLDSLESEKDDESDIEEIDEEWVDLEDDQEDGNKEPLSGPSKTKSKDNLIKNKECAEITNSFVPLVQNIFGDFGKIEVLNNETSKVVERIKNITKCNVNILEDIFEKAVSDKNVFF